MSWERSIGTAQYLKKGIPKNPKYEHIRTKLDTGCSLSKYIEREIKNHHKYRKDELFKRLKETTFAKLVLQVASLAELEESENDEESHGPESDCVSVASDAELQCLCDHTNGSPQEALQSVHLPEQSGGARERSCFPRSTLQSVISGVGELDLDKNRHNTVEMKLVSIPQPADRPYPDSPYLLLDVRDREQYDQFHIISAHSYPIISLCRTMNPYTKEVLDYKNAMGKIIILYDEDERLASQAATAMCERGFENLYMLSGGLKAIAQKFPGGMTTGSLPASCLTSAASKGKKCCKVQQQPPQPAEKRWRFTSDELSMIQQRLEEMTSNSNSSSRMSSRLSSSSSLSTVSSARSARSSSSTARVQSGRHWK